MGRLHLSKDLNDSQKRHAGRIGISITEYQQHVIDRIHEMRDNILPPTVRDTKMKRSKVEAKNPILIVGNGPSLNTSMSAIKNFKGTIVSLDINYDILVRNGIMPDYILTLEVMVRPSMFHPDHLDRGKGKVKLVGSGSTHQSVLKMAEAHGLENERWIHREEPRIANAGIFAVVYAKEVLKPDKIFLIGFEHDGLEYTKLVFEYWQYDFWYWIRKWDKECIVNCSDGGALYFEDYIIDSTLDGLVLDGDIPS